MKDTPVLMASEFTIDLLKGIGLAKIQKHRKYPKDRHTQKPIHYADIVTAFDIETSIYEDPEVGRHGFMYIWQWQIGRIATVYGRTWDEFLDLVNRLNAWLESNNWRMLVYVHNLAFEFQYLSGIWDFAEEDVFATDLKRPLYCKMGNLELRCSYRLAGEGLDGWSKHMRVDHQKLDDFHYTDVRYPWTPLTDREYQYCWNDVLSVVECVESMLHMYGDTLYTIPLTKTGYPRRKVFDNMRMWSVSGILSMQNDLATYDRLRAAFRGGDTHANRYFVTSLLSDVRSYDRSSSYPDVIVHCKFPMSKFREEPATFDRFRELCEEGNRACLVKVAFYNIRLEVGETGNPYLSFDKCSMKGYRMPIMAELDNGRILRAQYCEIAMTEIDYRIIEDQYSWDHAEIQWLMSARYGFLPQPLIDVVLNLYRDKTALKGVEGEEVRYQLVKADLNSIYGMMCQQVISVPIAYQDGTFKVKYEGFNREEEYNKAIGKAKLNYAWAVWTTAWARWRLYEGIKIATADNPLMFVYCDTDSIKARCDIDLDKYNQERIRDAKASGAYAVDAKGVIHYMGVFEYEGTYDQFVTLGAKRYCYVVGGKLVITVAGVPKEKGADELQDRGGIESFLDGFIFHNSGKLESFYNDCADIWVDTPDGIPLHITRNVYLAETTYNLKLEENYALLVSALQDTLDARTQNDYYVKRSAAQLPLT